jgi:hypothetical protein
MYVVHSENNWHSTSNFGATYIILSISGQGVAISSSRNWDGNKLKDMKVYLARILIPQK